MSNTRSVLVVSAVLLFSCFAFSETAAGIIARAKENSAKAQEKIKDLKIVSTAVMEMQGRKMTVRSVIFQKDKKIRIEATSTLPGTKDEMETVMLYDGKTTWMISPMAGKQQKEGKAIGLNTISEEEEWWTKVAPDIELKGEEKAVGMECYVLESKSSKDISKIWIGKKDLVLVRAVGEDAQSGKFEVESSEFKDVGFGWMLANKTNMKTDGGVLMNNSVLSVEVNKGLKDDIFEAGNVDPSKLKMPKLDGFPGGGIVNP